MRLLNDRVVGLNSSTEAKFFAQVPPAFLELGAELFTGRRRPLTGDASGQYLRYYIMLGLGSTRDAISFMAFVTSVLLLLPLVAASSCTGLSIFRLLTITRHKQYRDSGADDSKANVLRALIFFYALVLAQGGLFLIWLGILTQRIALKKQVCSQYHLEGKDEKLIDKYIDRTSSACIKTGVLNTINRKLVSFAIDLLHSEYSKDRISGVQVLHTLTSVANKTHNERAVAHIQSSPDCIARMFVLLSSKNGIDEDSKVNLAQIVTKISKELRLSDIDGAMESISSLVDPYLTKISTPADDSSLSNGQQQGNSSSHSSPSRQNNGEKKHPLIIHGLMILAKLAGNPDNCTKIFSTKDLFSKITAPISNKLYTVFTDDESGTAIEITEKSLRVVSKLVKGTHDINREIRHEICGKGLVVNRIYPILKLEQRYNSLKVPAIKILSQLALVNIVGDDAMVTYIHHLMGLLFDDNNETSIKKAAAKALVLLATDTSTTYCATIMNFSRPYHEVHISLRGRTIMNWSRGRSIMNWSRGAAHSVVQQLSPMLSVPSYQNAVAQLLTQFCVNSTDAETRALLKSILHEVLNVICEVDQALGSTNQQSNSQQQNRRPAEVILQCFAPCVDTSSGASRGSRQGGSQYLVGDNGGNRRSAPATPLQLQALFRCLGTSSPANQSGGGGGNTLPNQTVAGSQNPREEDGSPAQGIIQSALRQLNRLVNVPGAYSNIRGDHVKTQPASTPIKADSRKTLVAFLGLALQICDKLSDAAGFDAAVAQITDLSDGADLVDKLVKIIGMCNKDSVGLLKGRGPSVDYLKMVKSATKLCAWIMRTKPSYVAYFQDKNMDQKLTGALEAIRGLELGELLTRSADEVTNYETLSSIVEDARSLITQSHQTTPQPQPPV